MHYMDQELARNFDWILENDIEVEDFEQNFTYTIIWKSLNNTPIEIELEDDGKNKMVNNQNKNDYVKAVCKAYMISNIEQQTSSFIEGLEEIIPC